MASRLNPYISFAGNAREALEFYHAVFGGQLAMSTFGEFGQAGTPIEDQIMHGMLETAGGFTIMASDTPPGMDQPSGSSISISLSGDDDEELRGYWDSLSSSGTTVMPLENQMWGDTFGMCVDRFGVSWLVNITGPAA